MTPPSVKDLYKLIKEKAPYTYEVLISLDRDLAELHRAGMQVQRYRLHAIEQFEKEYGIRNLLTPILYP